MPPPVPPPVRQAHASIAGCRYERGEGRFKHRWSNDEAGFEPSPNGPVGKCHNSITETVAEDLLRDGVPEESPFPHSDDPAVPPARIFNLYRGVPYVAVTTQSGSYHGFPWRGPLPASVEDELLEIAHQRDVESELKRWLRKYPRRR